MKKLYFFFLLVFSLTLGAQNTVGLLSYQPTETFAGYNLIYPHNQPNVYLIDNCGEVVHVWEDEPDWRPGNTAYLLDDGRLVKTKRQASVAGNPIWAGGGGAIVEIRSWDNELLWSFERNDENNRLHHDIAMTPQGTILMIVWEKKTMEEAMAIGRSPFLLSDGELWPDYVIEVDPTTDEIVWEWHVWDHLVQDIVPELSNFDAVGSRPERVNVNWETNDSGADWMHTNSIDFDPLNNQVILSVPTFHEFWIIDHSTSTEQAATSNGGLSGRGGDLMYRWGNPAAYQQGTEADQKLFYQHDVHIIDDLLPVTHPYYGKMALFNNRVGADFSTANVLSLNFDMYAGEYPMTGSTWGPSEFDVVLQHPEPTQLYSTGLSSIQFLPNGNALIMDGRHGYAFELSPGNEVVWEYLVPLAGGQPATQGDILEINNNLTFRMTRYPLDYGAFTDRDLTGEVWIEQSPDSTFCDFILPTNELMTNYQLEIYPNPTNGQLTIEWEGGMMIELRLLDLLGRTVYQSKESGGRCYLSAADWHAGMYIVQINGVSVSKVVVR
ncbi:aryl-sulfate sulfotransferase [Lewinella cohaerens]|uniref:aryl-sulfate sulfotransferase n=1 Tax=Lewinella cohaerens TaxID=70995 RepID=UPI00037E480D|nr:aryl-sulfate sulfotransferase [Lewinella cohaerens]